MSTQTFADRRSLEGAKPGVVVVGGLLALMWVLEIIDSASFHALDQLGIIARNIGSLPHILTAPWLHFGFPHLISNSVPFLILGLLTWLAGPGRWLAVTLITVVTSGLTVWLIAPSNTITLGPSSPGAPTGVRISAGEGSLTASWTPGAAVPGTQTVYRVVFHSDNGDITRTTTGTSLSIGAADGVHAGGSYSVTVTAVARSGDSEVGSSKGVSSGSSATPYGKPGDFEVTNVVQTSSGVTVYWQGASANHAGPVSYTVNVSGPESHTVNAGSGLSSSIKLSASGTYTFTVTATTKAGSTASRNSKSLNVDLRSKPPAPSGLRATASDTVPNQVTASAKTQSGNGWSAGDLTIEYKGGDRGWTSSATFDGLRTGQNVTVSARAYGTRGDGQTVYSDVATSSVTVVGHPADPDVRCDDVASDGTLWCSWTDSPSSGSPNPDITYSAFETAASEAPLPGGQWQDPAGRTLTTSVPEGQSRGWCVVATNNYGFSSQDCEWEKNSHQHHHHQPQAKQAG